MKREPAIDILRFIGLSLLILAHVDSPDNLRQVRLFDVPLMVFISGLSYGGKSINNIGNFYWSRIKRLLIPVWSFIPIYFLPLALLQYFGMLRAGLTWEGFFCSFFFYGSEMGYIWIFKVFLIVMLFTPLLLKINQSIKNDIIYLIVILIIIIIQEIICSLWNNQHDLRYGCLIETYGLYIFGYLPLFMLGLRARQCSEKSENKLIILVGSISLLAVYLYFQQEGLPIQLANFKYPPRAYYIVYGSIMSLLLWRLKNPINRLLNNKYVIYIGQNSDWIYLWHAFFVFYITYAIKLWPLQYIIIYSLALLCCLLQKSLVKKCKSEFIKKYY